MPIRREFKLHWLVSDCLLIGWNRMERDGYFQRFESAGPNIYKTIGHKIYQKSCQYTLCLIKQGHWYVMTCVPCKTSDC